MATTTSRLNSLPMAANLTTNPLIEVYAWLDDGDYVVLHAGYKNKTARCFHKCLADIKTPKQVNEFLQDYKIIYYDVACEPILLHDGHWERSIKAAGYTTQDGNFINAGFRECTCSLKDRVSCKDDAPPKGLPYAYYMKLHALNS
jgi:hypothetical protein